MNFELLEQNLQKARGLLQEGGPGSGRYPIDPSDPDSKYYIGAPSAGSPIRPKKADRVNDALRRAGQNLGVRVRTKTWRPTSTRQLAPRPSKPVKDWTKDDVALEIKYRQETGRLGKQIGKLRENPMCYFAYGLIGREEGSFGIIISKKALRGGVFSIGNFQYGDQRWHRYVKGIDEETACQ